MKASVNLMTQIIAQLKKAVHPVLRHKVLVLAISVLVMVLATLFILLAPKTYESEMEIVIRDARPGILLASGQEGGPPMQADEIESEIRYEMELLQDHDVADRVVDPDWSSSKANDQSLSKLKKNEKDVEYFKNHLRVAHTKYSHFIHVTYEAETTQEANATLEKLLNVFFAKKRELEGLDSASIYFAHERERAKVQLVEAKARLIAYDQKRLIPISSNPDSIKQEIALLQQGLRATEAQIGEISGRLMNERKQLRNISDREATQQRTIPNTASIEQLSTLILTLRNQKTMLLTKFTTTDRLVQEVDQKIVNTTETLKNAVDNPLVEEITDVNPVKQQVKLAMMQSSLELSGAIAYHKVQFYQLSKLQALLLTSIKSASELDALQSRILEIQASYDLYTKKLSELQVVSGLSQHQLENVGIAERPTYSTTAIRPGLWYVSVAALSLAVCLAMSSILLIYSSRFTSERFSQIKTTDSTPASFAADVEAVDLNRHDYSAVKGIMIKSVMGRKNRNQPKHFNSSLQFPSSLLSAIILKQAATGRASQNHADTIILQYASMTDKAAITRDKTMQSELHHYEMPTSIALAVRQKPDKWSMARASRSAVFLLNRLVTEVSSLEIYGYQANWKFGKASVWPMKAPAGISNLLFLVLFSILAGKVGYCNEQLQKPARYALRRGDSISLEYRYTPEFNQTVVIQSDGFVSLGIGGELRILGLTLPQAHDLILQRASQRLNGPELNLILKEFKMPCIWVSGEVTKTGCIDFSEHTSALQAVVLAGGFKQSASQSEIIIFRHAYGAPLETVHINLKGLKKKSHLDQDIELETDDIVFVSRK